MTRSLFVLTSLLVAAAITPAWSQPIFTKSGNATFNTLTAGSIGAAATVNGTPLGNVATMATAALPAASLPTATFRANFDDISRALADRMSDHLNVKAFGAKGDGVTDDTLAFQHAAAVATGHIPNGIGASLSSYLSTLTTFLGIGPKLNSAVEIDIPAGHYVLTAPITVNYQTNTAIHWKGDGSSMTELEFRGGVDGIVTTFAPNTNGNEGAREGNWLGQGIEVEGIHFIANTGIVPAAAAGASNIGNGQGESGTAIKTIAIPLINASMPPFQIYRDLLFTNSGGWTDAANNWKGALYLQDPDNLFIEKVAFIDHSLDTNRTSIPVWLHSTASATGPGHGSLNIDYPLILGGLTGIQIDGNAFQGINITHAATIGVRDGITWLANPSSLSGSITLADSSLGGARYLVYMTNVSTVYSHDNFFYNTSPPKGTNPIFFYVTGGDTVISHHDQFYGPLPGYEGSGFSSAAMFVTGFGTADTAPSHISDDTVSHFDYGILYGGGSTMNFTNDVVSSDTTNCYRDTSASTTPSMRGQFDGIYCGGTVNAHDGVGLTADYDWIGTRFMNGDIELGLPGITSAGGQAGAAGILDFHSIASSNGTVAGLNNYDVRLTASGGTAGTNGAAALNLYGTGGLNLVNGPLTGSTMRLSGAASMGSGSVAGNFSIGQYLILGAVTMANLPSGCGAGGLIYVSDGRKTGEASGAGSGVPAVCLPTSKGGATGWYALQPSTLSN
ncbi:glycoside hydrolase family 55 protein [Acetobacteraceae bacterium KSS8]|uniref:Glycoside hydrolase family 55 protein n=1 Tax=Endosaccharibacter trunci TaxID=2812733 RepID=A0ABT1WA63_9PROT|nr:glycoside hydrolase family 55 protein [Acetobacteraceae bacterium KSS8]